MSSAKVIQVDPRNPDAGVIADAAAMIRAGELVAFPTETVYGLGANALETDAVAKIFAAKGRPATNPVIVHVADVEQAQSLTTDWTPNAAKLAAAFWPGPLTLVLRKAPQVPTIVTAGGDTVAVRCPDHAVAQALIRASGVPIAAPSANRSTELSPTRAEHVLKSLGDRITMILDGGPCSGGIESTVVDVTGNAVRILRPGLIDAAAIESIAGKSIVSADEAVARSPGMIQKHYSPQTRLMLAEDESQAARLAEEWDDRGGHGEIIRELSPAMDTAQYAARMYDILHQHDGWYDALIVVMPPDRPEWQAIRDRLTRAATTINDNIEPCDIHNIVEKMTRLIAAEPRNADAYRTRAVAWISRHDRPRAIADYDTAIKINPKNISYRSERAQQLFLQRQYEACIEDCTIVNTPETIVLRGRCQAALGNSAAALADFTAAGAADLNAALLRELGEAEPV